MAEGGFLCMKYKAGRRKNRNTRELWSVYAVRTTAGEHIPAYALLREGRAEEAEMLMNWIAVRGLTIGKMIETGCLSF